MVKKRLQKNDWHSLKNELQLIKYMTNNNGNIKGFYKDKNGNIYSHWLNDREKNEFKLGGKNVSKRYFW